MPATIDRRLGFCSDLCRRQSSTKRLVETLSDSYLKNKLRQGTQLRAQEIPESFVQLLRTQLTVIRFLQRTTDENR